MSNINSNIFIDITIKKTKKMEEFIWEIKNVHCLPSVNNLEDVIKIVRWKYKLVTDNVREIAIEGTTRLGEPSSDSFISFDDITDETVIGWIEADLTKNERGIENFMTRLDIMKQQLISMNKPVDVQPKLVVKQLKKSIDDTNQ
jgi:hypothetical protein